MTSSTPASEFVTDTMGLVLRIEQRRLPPPVKAIFDTGESGNATVYVPTMVFAEILYLAEKQRISVSLRAVAEHLEKFQHYQEYPMSLAVIQAAALITDIPELHDRLIAGTARLLHLDLITNDPTIQASTFVRTVW
jgi:predicted nucleic acid-binding protein